MRLAPHSRLALIAGPLSLLIGVGVVAADQPPWANEHHDLHAPWSVSPMLGAFAGSGSDGSTLDLELGVRWRYGDPPDDKHGHRSPRLIAFGLAAASSSFETLEPSVFVGGHLLPWSSTVWSQNLYWNLRADVGAGYRFGFDARSSSALVNAKLSLGLLFGQSETYLVGGGDHERSTSRDVFCGEVNITVKSQRTLDGDWRLVAGVEFDPLRLFGNIRRLVSYRGIDHYRSCWNPAPPDRPRHVPERVAER